VGCLESAPTPHRSPSRTAGAVRTDYLPE
jgi:hypothetical protein